MAKTISCLLNNTALKLNGILNKALKTYRPLIAFWLVDVTKIYFAINYYLKLRKVMTTVVLCKKGKADYLLLESYHPIALKNTFSKILKRVIVEYIIDIIKKHTLLPQS